MRSDLGEMTSYVSLQLYEVRGIPVNWGLWEGVGENVPR
jgi:hypothetical protein